MKAAYIERPGPPDTIQYGDLPEPTPEASQVLVEVDSVAVNPVDTYIRSGVIALDLPRPFIIGCDVAGVVKQVGPQVTRFRPGDHVWGSNQGLLGRQGTFAEQIVVDECWLYTIPQSVDSNDAAAIALVGITAHLGLFRDAGLQAGETVFVHGGSGGVGSCVVQMAKAVGARVATTGGTDEKVGICGELGADLAVNYKTQDVDAELRRFAPEGVDVWWETLREPDFDRTIEHLARGGRMVVMAGRDARPAFPVGPFYVKDCKLFGFAMFNASADQQRHAAEAINGWMIEKKLKPRIDRVLPLAQAAEAHRLQEANTLHHEGTLAGKIVLHPRQH